MVKITQPPLYCKCPLSEKHCSNCGRCCNKNFFSLGLQGNEYDFCSRECGNQFFAETIYFRDKF